MGTPDIARAVPDTVAVASTRRYRPRAAAAPPSPPPLQGAYQCAASDAGGVGVGGGVGGRLPAPSASRRRQHRQNVASGDQDGQGDEGRLCMGAGRGWARGHCRRRRRRSFGAQEANAAWNVLRRALLCRGRLRMPGFACAQVKDAVLANNEIGSLSEAIKIPALILSECGSQERERRAALRTTIILVGRDAGGGCSL